MRFDSVGSNDLTDNNTVGSAAGMHNLAASFVAGNNEWLSSSGQVIPSGSDFTVAHWLWTAPAEPGTGMVAWKTHGASQAQQHGVFFEPANGSNHRIYNTRGYGTAIEVGDNRGSWILVIYQYVDATTTTKVMGMGTASNSGVWSSDFVASSQNNTEFDLGGPDNAVYLNGRLDEVGIWSRVLTDDERTELYNAGAGKFYPFAA